MRASGVLQRTIELVVPFFDIDSMDIVWHGHYVKYLEVARCALLDDIGHNYADMKRSGFVWPVIDLQMRYLRAAKFGQRLCVRADLIEWENRLKLHYLIQDAHTGERLTRATTTQVAVHKETSTMQLVSPTVLVDAVLRRLHAATPSPQVSP